MNILKIIINSIAIFFNQSNTGKKTFIYYLFYYFSQGFLDFFYKFNNLIQILQPFGRRFIGWPKLALIHPGVVCNRKCEYCYETSIFYNNSKQLSIENYKKILFSLKKLKVTQIQILGREPLLYPQLINLLEFIKKENLDTVLYTNGLIAGKDMLLNLLPFKNILSFAWSLESEEISGGKSNLELSLKNLLLFKKYGFNIKLFIVVTKVNFRYIPSLLNKTYIKHGIIPVFARYMPCGDPEIDSKFNLTKKQWYKILNIQKKIQKKEKIINIGKISAYIRGYGCSDYFDSIHISYDGKIYPCDYILDRITIGDIKKDSIEDIWEIYKKNIRKWNLLPDDCKNCHERFFCHGGRRSHSYILNNNFKKIDPLCLDQKCPLSY